MNEEKPGFDIVFIAKRPGYGQVVIGWYKNATVYHKAYRQRRGLKKGEDWDKIWYVCEVDSSNVTLLPENERTFEVPRGSGYPGQSNVWYGDPNRAPKFLKDLRELMAGKGKADVPPNPGPRGGGKFSPDKEYMLLVEKAAINLATEHYVASGYAVKSVEQDNRGWDLEASKGEELLLLEVKGHGGNVINFELTPNEYGKMKEHKDDYRVCVVRNCISTPDLAVFLPVQKGEDWLLENQEKKETILLTEKVAAKAISV